MLRSITHFFLWLISFLIAVAIGLSIFAVVIPAVVEFLFAAEWTGIVLLTVILPAGCFAGYWAGVRAYRIGKRLLSAYGPVVSTSAAKPGDLSEVGSPGAAGASAPIGFP